MPLPSVLCPKPVYYDFTQCTMFIPSELCPYLVYYDFTQCTMILPPRCTMILPSVLSPSHVYCLYLYPVYYHLTQLLHVGIEIHTSDSVSVSFIVPFKSRILLENWRMWSLTENNIKFNYLFILLCYICMYTDSMNQKQFSLKHPFDFDQQFDQLTEQPLLKLSLQIDQTRHPWPWLHVYEHIACA